MSINHVYPLNDLRLHSVEDGGQCECEPRVEFLESGDTLVVHNSFDGREIIEALENLPAEGPAQPEKESP